MIAKFYIGLRRKRKLKTQKIVVSIENWKLEKDEINLEPSYFRL